MGNHKKSKDYLLLLVKLKEDIYGKDSEEVLQSYFDLGSVSKELNDYEDSLKYRLKSLDWELRNSGEFSEDTETAYNNVGAQYRELGQYEKALEYIQKAYDISREMSRTKKESIYLNRLGRVYVLKGESETAKSKFEEAISLLSHDHPEAIDSKERLNEIELNK